MFFLNLWPENIKIILNQNILFRDQLSNHFKKIKLRKINEILYISQHNKDNTLPLNEEKIINLLQK